MLSIYGSKTNLLKQSMSELNFILTHYMVYNNSTNSPFFFFNLLFDSVIKKKKIEQKLPLLITKCAQFLSFINEKKK